MENQSKRRQQFLLINVEHAYDIDYIDIYIDDVKSGTVEIDHGLFSHSEGQSDVLEMSNDAHSVTLTPREIGYSIVISIPKIEVSKDKGFADTIYCALDGNAKCKNWSLSPQNLQIKCELDTFDGECVEELNEVDWEIM